MKVVVAIDSLKGCLTSREANRAAVARENITNVLQKWVNSITI